MGRSAADASAEQQRRVTAAPQERDAAAGRLAAVDAELRLARGAQRSREVELLVDTRARLLFIIEQQEALLRDTEAPRVPRPAHGARSSARAFTWWWHEQELIACLRADAALHARAARGTEPAWADAWLYSRTLADTLGMRKPYQQWLLYATMCGGCAHVARRYHRARHVVSYVRTNQVEHLYLANVPEHEAPRMGYLVSRVRARGAAAALREPLLWLAWRASSAPTQRWQQQQSSSAGKPYER